MAKKYDIRVIELGTDGQKKSHDENGVMANSPAELARIYQLCGQEIQVLREYSDNESENYGRQKLLDSNGVQMCTDLGGTGLMKVSEEDQKKMNDFIEKDMNKQVQARPPIQFNNTQKEPPKFFTVGGIKCKMENGKLYQKQWIRLSEDESNEIRIVSDKNNKICVLKDKHIESLKWVMVDDQDKQEKEQEDGKVLLNG